MKRNFKNLLMFTLIAGSLSMYSCKETKEDEAAEPMQHEMREGEEMDHDMDKAVNEDEILKDEITAQFENQEVGTIYQHYINIKNALVQTDATMAQDRAKEMVAALESTEANAAVAAAAQKIATESNVNIQREAFSDLTTAMEAKLQGALASGEIYKQYCPMAFEGKGDSWFSNTKEIRNPYYGDKMLKCGRVEATIK
ncbi:MAG TPA: DUF3347 domain-containing protein [Gillisia sp.]|nr:DUF3347 domain-containing protein [Gillisia sp.]